MTLLCITAVPVFGQYGFDFTVVEDTIQSSTSNVQWNFVIENTGSLPDTYTLDLRVLDWGDSTAFIQHCAGGLCVEPGIVLTVDVDPGQADSNIHVDVFFVTGPDTIVLNYHCQSQGAPALMDSFNLYAISELGVEEDDSETEYRALSVLPNPFSKLMYLSFEVGSRQKSVTSIAIYDISGRLVKAFDPLLWASSPMHLSWDGTDTDGVPVPQGIYIVRVEGPTVSEQTKIVKLQ